MAVTAVAPMVAAPAVAANNHRSNEGTRLLGRVPSPSRARRLSAHMMPMTALKLPVATGKPAFDLWLHAKYGRRAYMIFILFVVSVFYLSATASLAFAGIPMTAYDLCMFAAVVLVVVYAVVKLLMDYKRDTKR